MENPVIKEVLDVFQSLKPGTNCEDCEGFLKKTCPAIALIEKTSLCMGSYASAESFLASSEIYVTLPQNAIGRVTRLASNVSSCPGGKIGINSFTPGHSIIPGAGQPGMNACVVDDLTQKAAEDAGVTPSLMVVPMAMMAAQASQVAMEDDLTSLCA